MAHIESDQPRALLTHSGHQDGKVLGVGQTSVWYQVSHNPYSPDLEEYQYTWKIPGVYDFRVWNRSGDVSWGWISGDCEAGDWPPHPPHP